MLLLDSHCRVEGPTSKASLGFERAKRPEKRHVSAARQEWRVIAKETPHGLQGLAHKT